MKLISPDVKLGLNVKVCDFVNLYGCEIGDESKIGTFVEIQKGARIGRRCKISSHTFICEGVTIEDEVFIGHNVTFINDAYPRATNPEGSLQMEKDWVCVPTRVKHGASIGSSATVLCGITVGERAIVGAGSVVTRDVPPGTIVAGNPARVIRQLTRENPVRVPFVDLKTQHRRLREEVEDAFGRVLDQASFSSGPFVLEFEKDYAAFCGCDHAVGVSSGTAALWLALLGLGVGPGNEVITVPNTFVATAEAIRLCGAKPVFVDVLEETYTLDPARVSAAITSRTKAILPVHLFGHVADLDPVVEIARARGLFVVEDASQSQGAEYKGRRAGSIGDAGCFSFYPSKNLGACGEAGAVVTNDGSLAERIRLLRDHGQASKYSHVTFGWNARMDGLQGAVLRTKLKYLESWNELRRKNAALYNQVLSGVDELQTPREMPYAKHVYHIYAVRTEKRDALKTALEKAGIDCAIHYPLPLHLQEAFNYLELKTGTFPVAEAAARELLSLPMFPELTEEQIQYVGSEIRKFFQP